MTPDADFLLHERLGRRRNRHIRLTRAAVCLLVAALVVWLVGLGWSWQLLLSLLAGLLGLVWPVHGSPRWALDVIGEQGGLAYETALEMEIRDNDAYGLRSAVRSRARSAIAGVQPPQFADWWLAALVVAAAILLLPALQLSPPWLSTPSDPSPGEQTVLPASAEDEAEADQPVEAGEQEEQLAEALPPQAPLQSGAPAEPGSPQQGAGSGAESEGQVLDRFLDNLRERPRQAGSNAEIPGAPVPTQLDEPTDPSEDESEGTSPSEGGQQPPSGPAGGEPGADSGGDPEAGDQDQESQAGGPEEQAQGGEPGDDSGSDDPGGPEAGSDDAAAQDGQSLNQGEGDGDGAGAGPGLEMVTGQDDRPGQAGGQEELLQGELSGSEVNLGGDVRLPGFTDVELPPGSSPARLGEAVERSLTEGTVPLEYQEVIRNYFR